MGDERRLQEREWLIHVDVWQKPTQYYKAIKLQKKKNQRTKK